MRLQRGHPVAQLDTQSWLRLEVMKLALRVLNVVEDGPAHCYDVADELGIDMKTASATLSDLHADGLLIRRYKVKPAGRERECWVYERPNAKVRR